MKRSDIMFALMTGVFGGAAGLVFTYLLKFGFKEESVFALIGAIIGAIATVGGAIFVDHWRRTGESRAEISLLVHEYGKLLEKAMAAQEFEPPIGQQWPEEYRPRLGLLAEASGDAFGIASEALTHGKSLTLIVSPGVV